MADDSSLVPRLCHIVRWPDFNGFGFNIHAQKGKLGQFIGRVDEGSPAATARLREGDRIVEVNGVYIGGESHHQVVNRIKAGGTETRLLVVDPLTDEYYKFTLNVQVRGNLPEVLHFSASRDQQSEPSAGDDVDDDDDEPPPLPSSLPPNAYDDDPTPPVTPPPTYDDDDDDDDAPALPNTLPPALSSYDYVSTTTPPPSSPIYENEAPILPTTPPPTSYIDAPSTPPPSKYNDAPTIPPPSPPTYKKSSTTSRTPTNTQYDSPPTTPPTSYNDHPITHSYDDAPTSSTPPPPAEPSPDDEDVPSTNPVRLCRLQKWADFPGFGFNLHAEKEKPGQFIGKVDPKSPAEAGGLKEGDRIIEVNGENIETMRHGMVIHRVKAGGSRTDLLVVDTQADAYYKERGIPVSAHMSGVKVIVTPSSYEDTASNRSSRTSEVRKSDTPSAESQHQRAESQYTRADSRKERTSVAKAREPEPAVIKTAEPIPAVIKATEPTPAVIKTAEPKPAVIKTAEPKPAVIKAAEPKPAVTKTPEPEPEPEPAVIRSTVQSSPKFNDGLNMNVSAAEMRELLKSRKKKDPRFNKYSFEAKSKMFEKL